MKDSMSYRVQAQLRAQPINGLGVRVVRGDTTRVIYRIARDVYKVITVGDMTCKQDKFYQSSSALLDALFPERP